MSTDAESSNIRVVVGQVGRPFGVRGQVFVTPLTDSPDLRLGAGARVSPADAPADFMTIVEQRPQSGRLVVTFEGFTTREQAAAITGMLLETEVDPSVGTGDDDEFYFHQLVGLEVVTDNGKVVGVIRRIDRLPDQDCLVVSDPSGHELLVPFVTEIVPTVDLANSRVVINPPPGLLDADDAS